MNTKVLLPILLLIAISCKKGQNSVKSHILKKVEVKELQLLLDAAKVEGTILIYDINKNTYYANDFDKAKQGALPASTYKIPHSIIGLETGILKSDGVAFIWDGTKRTFAAWEKDLSLREGFQKSCVPCFQELARKIGVRRMKESLEKLHFGKMDVTATTITDFWLTGVSKISPFQQIDFLKRFYKKSLDISEATYTTLRSIMILEKNETYTLSGKTGLVIQNKVPLGWFVGYLEKGNQVYFFATKITPKMKGMPVKQISLLRKKLTISALRELQLVK